MIFFKNKYCHVTRIRFFLGDVIIINVKRTYTNETLVLRIEV